MILHIAREDEWLPAVSAGLYQANSLAAEGFIHCSTPEQLLGPANALYRGQEGLVLLCIDPKRTTAPIIFEDCYQTGEKFPHIYGPLNVDAVTRVVPFAPGADGRFSWPAVLGSLR